LEPVEDLQGVLVSRGHNSLWHPIKSRVALTACQCRGQRWKNIRLVARVFMLILQPGYRLFCPTLPFDQ
jgi:hypothetical protein